MYYLSIEVMSAGSAATFLEDQVEGMAVEGEMVGTTFLEEKVETKLANLSQDVERMIPAKVEHHVEEKISKLSNGIDYIGSKEVSVEKRLMYDDVELHESMRMVEQALSTYNSGASSVDWFSHIVCRELSKLEKKERQRLSMEVMGGLVEKKDVLSIIEKKLKMVLVGAAQRQLSYKIELEGMDKSKLSQEESTTLWYLQHNLRYFVEVTVKYQIKMQGLVELFEIPLSSKKLLSNYYKLGFSCLKLENKLSADYGCMIPMNLFLRWNWDNEHYELIEDVSEEIIEAHATSFEAAD